MIGLLAIALLGALSCATPLERPEPARESVEEEGGHLGEEGLARLLERWQRAAAVSQRLRVGGVEFCGEQVAPTLGVIAARRRDFTRSFSDLAARVWGLGDSVEVVHVLADSAAERAGVRVGDEFVSVNGAAVVETTDVFERLRAARGGAIVLGLRRAGAELGLVLPVVTGCHHEALVTLDDRLGTYPHPNGAEYYLPTGLIRFAHDDDELAVAMAHEIGHRLLGGTLFEYPRKEVAADRLGLRIAASAGFRAAAAPEFWERLTLEHPWAIRFDSTSPDVRWSIWQGTIKEPPHGRMPERMLAIREALRGLASADAPPSERSTR